MQAHVLPTVVQMPAVHLRWRPFALPTSQPSRTTISCYCSRCLLPFTTACSPFILTGRACMFDSWTAHPASPAAVPFDGRPAYLMSDVASRTACISCCTPPVHLSTPLLHISRACKPRTRCLAHLSLVPAHTPGTLCWLQVAEPYCCSLAGISEWERFPGCLASRKRRSTCRRSTEPGRREAYGGRRRAAGPGGAPVSGLLPGSRQVLLPTLRQEDVQPGVRQGCAAAAAGCPANHCSLICSMHASLLCSCIHVFPRLKPASCTPPPTCSAQGRLGLLRQARPHSLCGASRV